MRLRLEDYYVNYPYHLCPLCGEQSGTTSKVCSKHMSVTKDQYGNVIGYQDYYTTQVTPISRSDDDR